jgi:epoxide hydrolase 4
LQAVPRGFRSVFVDCGEVKLHVVTNARALDGERIADDRPPIVFLHGFPEYWAGWSPVFPFLADDYLIIAPDQRGYNLSDAPQEIEASSVKHLVNDLLVLTSKLLGDRKFLLAGHDWGASVAYAIAINAPERLTGLVIANGVHPVVFQRALVDDREQIKASQYMNWLRGDHAAGKLAENDYALTLGMLEKFSLTQWMTNAERAGYREAWSQPGRLNAMLNWYRASPIVVPALDETEIEAPLANAPVEKLQVKVPHLLIWGLRDEALRPSSRAGLNAFAPDLEIVEFADADHWVVHTHAERVAVEITKFAERLKTS